MAWGLLPLYYAAAGLSIGEIGLLAAVYPGVWAVAQVATGAWSDRIGRKPLIVAGMLLQAGAIAAIAAGSTLTVWLLAGIVLGLGTALVYPTLLAAVADVAAPVWRGSAVGVYRLWRDLGFAVGAIVAGVVADAAGMASAIWVVAVITAASGLLVLVRMRETRVDGPYAGRGPPGGRARERAQRRAPDIPRAAVDDQHVRDEKGDDRQLDPLGDPAECEVRPDHEVGRDRRERVAGEADPRQPGDALEERERDERDDRVRNGQREVAEPVQREQGPAQREVDVGGRKGQFDDHQRQDGANEPCGDLRGFRVVDYGPSVTSYRRFVSIR